MNNTSTHDKISVLDDLEIVPQEKKDIPFINIPKMTRYCKTKGIEPPDLSDEEIKMLSVKK
jgi:hypothetical protein